MRKKKILVTNGHLNVGGVEKSLITFLQQFDFHTYDVDLLLFESLGTYADLVPKQVNVILWDTRGTHGSLKHCIVESFRKKRYKDILLKLIFTCMNRIDRRLLRLLRIFHIACDYYDAALAYRTGLPADYVAYVVNAKKKYIWWHSVSLDCPATLIDGWDQMLHKMDGIVCVSQAVEKKLTEIFPNQTEKLCVIPNMVNYQEMIHRSLAFHPYEAQKHTKQIIVSVGRLSSEKHMMDAVFISEALIQRGMTDFQWYLVGDGPEKLEILELIRNRQLEDYLVLVGDQENPYPFIRDADLFVHLSHVESQGLAVIEALALGKMSVVVKSLGTNEFVKDGINAIQAEQTLESLTEKVAEALECPDKMRFSDAAQETAREFDCDAIMPQIYNLIK